MKRKVGDITLDDMQERPREATQKQTKQGKTPALNGDDFEARSATLLQSYGLKIIGRQYRCKAGEIDLIAYDEHRLLFVEVRARRHRSYGGAAASVNRAKQCRITRCAAYFLNRHPQWRHLPCRFDVIAWEPGPAQTLEARWIQAAFLS